jgi:hypothetical protein
VAATPLPAFSIESLPPVEFWNSQDYTNYWPNNTPKSEFKNWPNPFQKADGTIISNPVDWDARRAEIKKILEYYFCGAYPDQPTAVSAKENGSSVTITVTANGDVTKSFTINSLTIPAKGPNGEPPSADNKVPLVLLVGAGGTVFQNSGYATVDFGANSDALNGIVDDIFSYTPTDPDRPSALVREAWRAARIIDAIEKAPAGSNLEKIDPRMLLTTGMSRWGKDAAYIGIFAESMKGTNIAVTNPVSSGSGGAAPDRFNAQAAKSANGINKSTYFYKPLDTFGGTSLAQMTTEAEGGVDAGRTNFGYQNMVHARGEQPNWFGVRFQEFTEMHDDWITNYQSPTNPPAGNLPDNPYHGYAGSMPFDAHFLTALAAPYGLLIHDGWGSAWTNAEGTYATYLATREVYDFIGKSENIGVRIYNIGHAQPDREMYDLVDFGNLYFNRTFNKNWKRTHNTTQYPVTPTASFMDKDPLFNGGTAANWFDPKARSPEGDLEYLKINWAAPNKPAGSSVAEVVAAYIDAHPEEFE